MEGTRLLKRAGPRAAEAGNPDKTPQERPPSVARLRQAAILTKPTDGSVRRSDLTRGPCVVVPEPAVVSKSAGDSIASARNPPAQPSPRHRGALLGLAGPGRANRLRAVK